MQYPYLTFLEIITLISALFIGIIILYFLIKVFKKSIKFSIVLKAILLYGFFAVIVYSIYPTPSIQPITFYLKILKFLIFGTILFLIFYFVTKKYFPIGIKKSLAVFLLMVLILFPVLGFSRLMFVTKIIESPVFAEETSRLKTHIEKIIAEKGIFGLYEMTEPLSFKILRKIDGGLFSWPGEYIRAIIMTAAY